MLFRNACCSLWIYIFFLPDTEHICRNTHYNGTRRVYSLLRIIFAYGTRPLTIAMMPIYVTTLYHVTSPYSHYLQRFFTLKLFVVTVIKDWRYTENTVSCKKVTPSKLSYTATRKAFSSNIVTTVPGKSLMITRHCISLTMLYNTVNTITVLH